MTTSAETAYVIVIEGSTPLQRDQVQNLIKEKAESWWHGLADAWIVTGGSAKDWRDLLGVFFPAGTGSILVIKIDTQSKKTWAFRSTLFTKSQKEWIQDHL